ncbi:helix-turn-helix domain-containing protein [Agromyces endophyticus]|uniref:helix-turn-helix domain-containing protein n=1 Tax=Agromyces sp. H17E-10 TaxID=2932244 RepID=UPI00351CE62D
MTERGSAALDRLDPVTVRPITSEDRAASHVLEATRRARGMPKAELARRAGLQLRTLHYYLDCERAMTVGTFRALCDALGLSREDAAAAITRWLSRPVL